MFATCAVCDGPAATAIAEVAGHRYFRCARCTTLALPRATMDRIDGGESLVAYSDAYWREEVSAARERSFGSSLARLAEAVLYARVPIRRFVDVGTGPGFLLDAVARHLPSHAGMFYGVEKFPPPPHARTQSANYVIGDVADLPFKIDGGLCIEVFEHLTPRQLAGLLRAMASVSTPGALYVVNTGLPDYVLNEDLAYLDPVHRGHLASYSLQAVASLAQGTGFRVLPVGGKNWAFVLEFQPGGPADDVRDRIWTALPENRALLRDPAMGSVLEILGRESARAYRTEPAAPARERPAPHQPVRAAAASVQHALPAGESAAGAEPRSVPTRGFASPIGPAAGFHHDRWVDRELSASFQASRTLTRAILRGWCPPFFSSGNRIQVRVGDANASVAAPAGDSFEVALAIDVAGGKRFELQTVAERTASGFARGENDDRRELAFILTEVEFS